MCFGNAKLRDLVLAELVDRKDTNNKLFDAMFAWQKATTEREDVMTTDLWDEHDEAIKKGQDALNEKVNAMIFLQRSGEKYEPYCQELYNSYSNGQDNFALTVPEQHTRLDAWKPAYTPTPKKTGTSFA